MRKTTAGLRFRLRRLQFSDGVTIVSMQGADGMSLRAYAAIKLRVPDSGLDWLDDMIRQLQRDAFAGQALPAIIRQCAGDLAVMNPRQLSLPEYFAQQAYDCADAMLAERAKGGAE